MAGLDYVYDPVMALTTVYWVAREGKKYAISLVSTGDLIGKHVPGEAKIYFSTQINAGERVSIVYQTNTTST